MNLEKLPKSLLNGKYLHCRPVEDGLIIRAEVVRTDELETTDRVVVCPARLPRSRCSLLGKKLCWYWRTCYIIGPHADQKTSGGYRLEYK